MTSPGSSLRLRSFGASPALLFVLSLALPAPWRQREDFSWWFHEWSWTWYRHCNVNDNDSDSLMIMILISHEGWNIWHFHDNFHDILMTMRMISCGFRITVKTCEELVIPIDCTGLLWLHDNGLSYHQWIVVITWSRFMMKYYDNDIPPSATITFFLWTIGNIQLWYLGTWMIFFNGSLVAVILSDTYNDSWYW